ncbi:ACT1 [Symbiodinium sp. CCMP2592]|nr:ACT1 [Symbiodinium sp. CCMP2592]
MASTARTSWTNQTIDLLRQNPHIDCKPVLKELIPETLKTGIRFVSQQSKATEGVRSVRLDAWFYIRRISASDVLKALRKTGFSSESLRKDVEQSMQHQKVYHVVIRGNDPKFMPFGKRDGQDLVTDYICEQMSFITDKVDQLLFEDLSEPSSIQEAMADHAFDHMLEQYFLRGRHDKEETLHLVSRFRGGGNLLHTCIKEGYLDSLRLLLDRFTPESQPGARWRALAEPLRPVGLYKCSAFHRAVFDGRPDCLAELVLWAQRHGHDITELRNVEERDIIAGSQRGLTCLELSEQEGNLACYNVLAPLFGAPKKECATDAKPRETRVAERTMARVEIASASEQTLQLRPVNLESQSLTWEVVLDSIRDLKRSDVYKGLDPSQMVLRLENLVFVDDASEVQVDRLLAESSGMAALEANSCIWKTEKTALSFLAVVVGRLEMEASSRLPPRMPQKVHVSSPVAEDLPFAEEDPTDRQVVSQLLRFAAACGRWPHFLGARNGMLSHMQALRLASRDTQSHAATIAAIYATRLNFFLGHLPSDFDDEGVGEWLRKQQLMPLARAVFSRFYNLDKLLAQEPEDVNQAMELAVVPFLKLSLSAWFATVPRAETADIWRSGLGGRSSEEAARPSPGLCLGSHLEDAEGIGPHLQADITAYTGIFPGRPGAELRSSRSLFATALDPSSLGKALAQQAGPGTEEEVEPACADIFIETVLSSWLCELPGPRFHEIHHRGSSAGCTRQATVA